MFGGRIGVTELIIILLVIAVVIKAGRTARFVVGGILLGAIVGFLLRPSVPIVGQLPFDMVITRGANLQGMGEVLRPAAERSFNYMLVGAIVGAVGLGIAAGLTAKQKIEDSGTRAKGASRSAAPHSTEGRTESDKNSQ